MKWDTDISISPGAEATDIGGRGQLVWGLAGVGASRCAFLLVLG